MADMKEETPRLPEGFKAFTEDTALPVPPIPLALVNRLQPMGDSWFETEFGSVPRVLHVLDDLDDFFEEKALANRDYAGFGLGGNPYSTPYAMYLQKTGTLELGLCLPWGGVYNDPESEKDDWEAALRIAEVCTAGKPEDGKLSVLVSSEGLFWQLKTKTLDLEGRGLDGLLTALEKVSESCAPVPFNDWLAV